MSNGIAVAATAALVAGLICLALGWLLWDGLPAAVATLGGVICLGTAWWATRRGAAREEE